MRLVLADDHAILRQSLRALLTTAGHEISGEAGDSAEATAPVRTHRPDVLVLDLSMPGGGGLAVLEALSDEQPRPAILVLTTHEDPPTVAAALDLGATAVLSKAMDARDLLQRLQAMQPSNAVRPPVHLSEREAQVLRRVALGHSSRAVGEELGISAGTVDTYRTRVADKLGLRGRADLVQYALSRGLHLAASNDGRAQ